MVSWKFSGREKWSDGFGGGDPGMEHEGVLRNTALKSRGKTKGSTYQLVSTGEPDF